MPIYAYRCEACGHAKDVLQKISDPVLTVCPACGAGEFRKQLTAAGFQLKGSGWYVTDFKSGNGGGAKTEAAKPESGGDAKPAASDTKTESKSDGGTTSAAPAAGCGGSCACH